MKQQEYSGESCRFLDNLEKAQGFPFAALWFLDAPVCMTPQI